MSAAAAALAKRDAAFAKALQDLTRERNTAWEAHATKERARNPALGVLYERVCNLTEEKYHTARALAQKEYLASTPTPTPADEEWEAGL